MQLTTPIIAILSFIGLLMATPIPQNTPIACVSTFNACEAAAGSNANAITAWYVFPV